MASKIVPAIRPQSTPAKIAANEISRLWQAHGIIELAVHAIGDEVDSGGPAIKFPLQAAADAIHASIQALRPIATADDVAEVSHG